MKNDLHEFEYTITIRKEGRKGETDFDGKVRAETPKQAIAAALAYEFGEQNKSDYFNQISEWAFDSEDMRKQHASLDAEDMEFTCFDGDSEIFVDVNPV